MIILAKSLHESGGPERAGKEGSREINEKLQSVLSRSQQERAAEGTFHERATFFSSAISGSLGETKEDSWIVIGWSDGCHMKRTEPSPNTQDGCGQRGERADLTKMGSDWVSGWHKTGVKACKQNQEGGEREPSILSSRFHFLLFPGSLQLYLVGTLPDEGGEFRHHHIDALQTRLSQFENLLFHNGLKG